VVETWVTADNLKVVEKFFSNYVTSWVFAKQTATKGRPSGGVLLAVNRVFKNAEIKQNNYFKYIHISPANGQPSVVILPVYFKESCWRSIFNKVENFLVECNSEVVLVGDFNSHFGTLNSEYAKNVKKLDRQSMDSKIDSKGKNLVQLFSDYNLIILNGVIKGDLQGSFTFSGQCASVLDLVCTSNLDLIQDLVIEDRWESDHFPLNIGLNNIKTSNADYALLPLQKVMWKNTEQFKVKINSVTNTFKIPTSLDIDLYAANMISGFYSNFKQESLVTFFKKPWFDRECFTARKKVQLALKNWKVDKSSI